MDMATKFQYKSLNPSSKSIKHSTNQLLSVNPFMADPLLVVPQRSTAQTPLLHHNYTPPPPPPPPPSAPSQSQQQQQQHGDEDACLDQKLRKLETFLFFLGFNQSSLLSSSLSWLAFLIIGVLLPVLVLEMSNCPGCRKDQVKDFELDIVASQACLAAVSLICLSHNLRKYGIRRFLFVDRYVGHMALLRDRYIRQITESVRLLVLWSLPCFLLKTAREVIRILYVQHESWWISVAVLLTLVLSWTYEHIRLRYHLSKISHRFRIFLLLQFLVVTASQFVTLFQTTGYSGIITFINGGDFAVSSIVQVVGIIICLHAATKISSRAQGIASIASRWHAFSTCGSSDSSHLRVSNSMGNLEAANQFNQLHINYSESDLESMDYAAMPINSQMASYMSSYQKRQAFVLYLQMNPGGITIFGWTVDRALVNTIFFIELTLVTFVLGKTVVFTSR